MACRARCAFSGVYPRVCGGTMPTPVPTAYCWGLSPRVRGNLNLRVTRGLRAGSIPACAGEPVLSAASTKNGRVYPRVCGGTANTLGAPVGGPGLSPRVRGNRGGVAGMHLYNRSIPACAGEPSMGAIWVGGEPVYPRVCGGTWRAGRRQSVRRGLSPRVRGNPQPANPPRRALRSIPACAGEPR